MANIELVSARTSDGVKLDGVMFWNAEKELTPPVGLVFVHGVAHNFYNTPLRYFAEHLADDGYRTIVMNTRGHDWISESPKGASLMGAAFELMEHSLLDLDAFLGFLEEKGLQRIGLVGHSLGAAKVIEYQSKRKRNSVKAVISCSCAELSYDERHQKFENFDEIHSDAEWMVNEKRPEEIFRLKRLDGTTNFYSARTLIDKYGPNDKANALRHVRSITCPILLLSGKEESRLNRFSKRLYDEAKDGMKTIFDIAGADHYYEGHEDEMKKIMSDWLELNLMRQ